MNHQQLAFRLHELAHKIEGHISRLQGVNLGKAMGRMEKGLDSFEKALDAALTDNAPGMKELEMLLKAKDNAKHFKLPALRLLAKDIFGVDRPRGTTASELKRNIIKEAARRSRGEIALEKVKDFLKEAKAPKGPLPTDSIELGREFLRLGGLDDDAFEYEMETRWKKVGDLKKLAKANSMRVGKGVKKIDLVREIKHASRRAHGNVS